MTSPLLERTNPVSSVDYAILRKVYNRYTYLVEQNTTHVGHEPWIKPPWPWPGFFFASGDGAYFAQRHWWYVNEIAIGIGVASPANAFVSLIIATLIMIDGRQPLQYSRRLLLALCVWYDFSDCMIRRKAPIYVACHQPAFLMGRHLPVAV